MTVTDVFALWYIAKAVNIIRKQDMELTRYKIFYSSSIASEFEKRNDIIVISSSRLWLLSEAVPKYIVIYKYK